jgi:hypothetical protein
MFDRERFAWLTENVAQVGEEFKAFRENACEAEEVSRFLTALRAFSE